MKHPDIPAFAYRLFKWFCKADLFEELEGDLEESFLRNKAQFGIRKAKRIYFQEVLKMIRPTVISRPNSGPVLQTALFISHINISLRNLKRHKLFSFINIFSLSVAMSSGLLVIGMISDLLKFDEFHENKHKIYRVISTPYQKNEAKKTKASSPLYLGEEMASVIPNIQYTNLGRRLQGDALANEKKVYLKGIYADAHFFDFLSFQLTSGNEKTVLKDPFQVVVSKSFVEKVFEDKNPIGELISIEGYGSFTISGVVENAPQFSHIQFDIIASISTVHALARERKIPVEHDEWTYLDRYYNYIYIEDDIQKSLVTNWLNNQTETYYKKPDEFYAKFELQAINEIVPGPNISDSIGPKMIYLPIIILSVIAGAILLSAIFNYTNLSMARSLRRAKEVGIRKLNGANGRSVFLQFSLEAIILSLLSLGLGILLFFILRNEFIDVLPRAEEMVTLKFNPTLLLWFMLFAVVSGLIAGLGPSIFFSKLTSLNALRAGKSLKLLSKINFRKSLIVAQFTLSIIFILAVVITHKQYRYSITTDLGFDKSNALNINLQGNDPDILTPELLKLPEVSSVSYSSFTPGVGMWHYMQIIDPRNYDSVWVHHMSVDESYLDNMSVSLVAGRNFRPLENKHTESSILVNETFVKTFGYETPMDILGEVIQYEGNSVQIVGVIKDFIYGNLEESIKSLVVRNNQESYKIATVKLASEDMLNSFITIENTWDKIDPKHRLDASFYDDQIKDYYVFLVDFMKIFGFIGFLAISISCLGLFGISLYTTETRMKEIGIRKTFGASIKTLIYLLTKGFIKMIMIAIMIGTPICYLLFDQVILAQNFYRGNIITGVEIGGSILLLLVVCLITIIGQTWQAAVRNPATVLRDE